MCRPFPTFILAVSIAACSDNAHPAQLPDSTQGTGAGGATSGGVAGSMGTGGSSSGVTSGSGSGGTGGSGPAGGGGSSGGPPRDAGNERAPTMPISMTFDPNEVYLLGTLTEGSCGRDVIANIKSPNTYAAGFWCYHPGGHSLQILGKKLVYLNGGAGVKYELLEFVPDLISSSNPSTVPYPDDPAANDIVIPTPACSSDGGVDDGVFQFLVGPTGRTIYQCNVPGSNQWYAENGSKVVQGVLLALGNDDLVAVRVDSSLRGGHMKLADGVVHPWPEQRIPLAIRAHPNGFHVALVVQTTGLPVELWEMAAEGKITKLGDYPALPAGALPNFSAALLSDDTLFAGASGLYDSVARLTITGVSETVYTEKSDPYVKLSRGGLFTGP